MSVKIRPVRSSDFEAWKPLWQGYCDYYGVEIPEDVTETTWNRFLQPDQPIHALVAEFSNGALAGMVHYLTHDSTWSKEKVCYLEDLFVSADARRTGVGEDLIKAVVEEATIRGWNGVYWLTRWDNYKGRSLYDRVAGPPEFLRYSIETD